MKETEIIMFYGKAFKNARRPHEEGGGYIWIQNCKCKAPANMSPVGMRLISCCCAKYRVLRHKLSPFHTMCTVGPSFMLVLCLFCFDASCHFS